MPTSTQVNTGRRMQISEMFTARPRCEPLAPARLDRPGDGGFGRRHRRWRRLRRRERPRRAVGNRGLAAGDDLRAGGQRRRGDFDPVGFLRAERDLHFLGVAVFDQKDLGHAGERAPALRAARWRPDRRAW